MPQMMKFSTFAIVFLLCFSSMLLVLGQVNSDSESTLRVLLEVKKSFVEDPQNVLGDWSEDNTDYCSWRGVSCELNSNSNTLDSDSVQVVVALNLSDSSLTGSISPSLGRLQNLLHLDLSSNSLHWNLCFSSPTNSRVTFQLSSARLRVSESCDSVTMH